MAQNLANSSTDIPDREEEMKESRSPEFKVNTGSRFSVESTPECPWYRNKCFDQYWRHYMSGIAWMRKHWQIRQETEMQQRMAEYADMINRYYGSYWNSYLQKPMTQSREVHGSGQHVKPDRGADSARNRGHMSKSAHPKEKQRTRKSAVKRRGSHASSSLEGSVKTAAGAEAMETDEGFEMNISEEFLQFLAESEKHRKERDAQKAEKSTEKTEASSEYVEIEEVSLGKTKATSLPPSQRPGLQRAEEMRYLYGEGAAKIHGMETAMQLNYDRNLDTKQPKLWPNMPLRLKFEPNMPD